MRFRNLARCAVCASVLGVGLVGCNKSEPNGAPSGGVSVSSDQADVYVQAKVDALARGDAAVVWDGLTTKQQADVKGLLGEASAKLDADVWNKSFAMLAKLAEVLKTKKDYILGSEMASGLSTQEKTELANNWPGLVNIVDALANSDLKTIDGLKNLDPGKFFATTGSTVFKETVGVVEKANSDSAADVKSMKNAKVSLVKQEGDVATLKFTTEGTPPKDVEFRRVDGKWAPAVWHDDWNGMIQTAKEGLAQATLPPEQKSMVLGLLGMVDGVLDALLKAPDQVAFNGALAPLKSFAPMIPGLGGPMGGPSMGAGGPVGVGPPAATGPGSLPVPGTLAPPAGTIVPPRLPLPNVTEGAPAIKN